MHNIFLFNKTFYFSFKINISVRLQCCWVNCLVGQQNIGLIWSKKMTTNWSFSSWRFQFLYICIDWMTLPIYDSLTFFQINKFFFFLEFSINFSYTRTTHAMACDLFALTMYNNENRNHFSGCLFNKFGFKHTKYFITFIENLKKFIPPCYIFSFRLSEFSVVISTEAPESLCLCVHFIGIVCVCDYVWLCVHIKYRHKIKLLDWL